MRDDFGRQIEYMRIAVTDDCNQKCLYCTKPDYIPCTWTNLTDDEIVEIVQTSSAIGIKKFRLTGGEPLVRPNIIELCERISRVQGVEELCISTNGVNLPDYAKGLKRAGVNRVNINLNTLDADKYRVITGGGNIQDVLFGLDAAVSCGMNKIKINCVLIGGFNEDEIFKFAELSRSCNMDVRFIELMPVGDLSHFSDSAFIPCSVVFDKVPDLRPVTNTTEGTARIYKLPDSKGRIGIISSLSNHFCETCNKIRVTADGCIKPCLHTSEEIHLKGLHGEELAWAIKLAIAHKPKCHKELSYNNHSMSRRDMNGSGG